MCRKNSGGGWKLERKSHLRLNGNSHMENYLMHPADHVQNKIFMKTIFHFLLFLSLPFDIDDDVVAIPSG